MKTLAKSRGFSLLEALLVIALLGLLASTIFVMLPRGGSEQDIILATEQLRTELSTMRSRARSGEDMASFGVIVATSSYTGIKVMNGATTTFPSELLPASIEATPATILFQSISGQSSITTITLFSDQASKTLQITPSGVIQ